ncbi:glutathionylspermidine synthase family protein [Silanimonas sp.]|jgi:glutathionylspermidine synthase|uniref:glutathionylspermidine synthase family protein n=1 Tax=Silanimonas sp. TaxID=1929290 RepID=UPI0037C78316
MRRRPLVPRAHWEAQAAQHGFAFHTLDGAPYWDERACYLFTLAQVERDIEDVTQELHAMALDLVDAVCASEALMARLAVPSDYRDWIARSWHRRDPHLYGRVDLAYDGRGPAKLYEFNYDTPTALYEAAYFQWLWLEDRIADGTLPPGADQYNGLQEAIVEAFGAMARERRLRLPLHFAAHDGHAEDGGTVDYLRDCAHQAGLETHRLAVEAIGLGDDGHTFADESGHAIRSLFKLYPYEFMFEDAFGPALRFDAMQLIEPPWKALLSNKAALALLWERHPGHPNLLECHIDEAPSAPLPAGWVRKPFFSREGANIAATLPDGEAIVTPGPYADGPQVRQAWHPLPRFDAGWPLIGSWVIGDRACGMGLREDDGPITMNTSRFVPHAIVG